MDRIGKRKGKPPDELFFTLTASEAVIYLHTSRRYMLLSNKYSLPAYTQDLYGESISLTLQRRPGPHTRSIQLAGVRARALSLVLKTHSSSIGLARSFNMGSTHTGVCCSSWLGPEADAWSAAPFPAYLPRVSMRLSGCGRKLQIRRGVVRPHYYGSG